MKFCSLQKGFTLLEVMVVIAIVAIMATIAAPSFTDFISQTRVNSAGSLLQNDISAARSEAIKRNVRVAVCAANAAGTDCAASTDWAANGWLVCVANAAGTCNLAVPVISARGSLANGVTVVSGTANAIIFRSTGAALAAETITITGTNGKLKVANVAATGFLSYH